MCGVGVLDEARYALQKLESGIGDTRVLPVSFGRNEGNDLDNRGHVW